VFGDDFVKESEMVKINWRTDINISGTSLVGYFCDDPKVFEETVAKLITLSGQDPTERSDGYKTSVEFVGTYKGEAFTLYDYKGDHRLHIGGRGDLNLRAFILTLQDELKNVVPTPYTAKQYYDEVRGKIHSYPTWEQVTTER